CLLWFLFVFPSSLVMAEGKHIEVTESKSFLNPISFISSVKLDGHNYEVWSRMFKMSIVGYKKKHIIEEDEPSHKIGRDASWEEDNGVVMAWLINNVEPKIANHLCFYKTAKRMWDFLRKSYSHDKNESRLLQIEEEIFHLKQGEQNLAEYFASISFAY
ncbi:hypothetical protein QML37_31535, partial [Klebsiella pneumoniae]|uniref:hypothetical protein n=1 Tax=Klebsiella pneumoniae TaxID=573 RepID=UPI003A80DA0C